MCSSAVPIVEAMAVIVLCDHALRQSAVNCGSSQIVSHEVRKGHKGMTENEIAKQLLDAAFVVHTKLGPGLLESVYEVV